MTAPRPQVNKRMRRLVPLLLREIQNMAVAQQSRIMRPLMKRGTPARLVEAKVDELITKRHRRRKARLQQKASRRRNRA